MISAKTIDHLFDKLAAVYGSEWDRKLGNAQLKDVKTVWGEELSRFKREDIVWALEHLPEQCPNVIKFKNLCREAPRTDAPLLPPPPPAEAKVIAENIAKQTNIKSAMASGVDPKEWAHILQKRHEAGEKLSPYQIACYRTALGYNGKQSWQ